MRGNEEVSVLQVVDWDRLQNPKKPEYPHWTKLHRAYLHDHDFMSMTMSVRGFFLLLQMLAAETGNQIPNDVKWIASRLSYPPQHAGVAISTLMRLGFVSRFVVDLDSYRIRRLTRISGTRPMTGEGEGEREERENKEKDLSPNADGKSREARIDQRSFEIINQHVLRIACDFKTQDPTTIYNLGGAGLNLSRNQIIASLRQLRERGALKNVH